jgi:hypothetical protein
MGGAEQHDLWLRFAFDADTGPVSDLAGPGSTRDLRDPCYRCSLGSHPRAFFFATGDRRDYR